MRVGRGAAADQHAARQADPAGRLRDPRARRCSTGCPTRRPCRRPRRRATRSSRCGAGSATVRRCRSGTSSAARSRRNRSVTRPGRRIRRPALGRRSGARSGSASRWGATRPTGSAVRRRCSCPPATEDVGGRAPAGDRRRGAVVRAGARLQRPAAGRGLDGAGDPARQGARPARVRRRPSGASGAGLPAPLAARKTAEAGWAGLHKMVGVPGTVGGGVFMNAGCHGAELVRRGPGGDGGRAGRGGARHRRDRPSRSPTGGAASRAGSCWRRRCDFSRSEPSG